MTGLAALSSSFLLIASLLVAALDRRARAKRHDQAFQFIRAALDSPWTFHVREAGDDHPDLRMLDGAKGETTLLEQYLVRLPDLIIRAPDVGHLLVLRPFIQPGGPILACIRCRSRTVSVSVETSSDTEAFITSRIGINAFAPPFQHTRVLTNARISELLADHRAWIATLDPTMVVRLSTIDDVIRELTRKHELALAWRAAQDPYELLGRDLRMILGRDYEQLGTRMMQRFSPAIPRATVHKR